MRDSREEFYDYLYPRSGELKKILYREMETEGKITFARFMDIVLYHPGLGYYTNPDSSLYNDYLTSPKLHRAFGELITEKILLMWEHMGKPADFVIVETGAGDGDLCRHILNSARAYHDFYHSLHYVILNLNNIEISEKKDKVSLCIYKDVSIPLKNVKGCFISNELLDAFPVHLITRRNRGIEEIFITIKDGEFIELYDSPSIDLEPYIKDLPCGNRIEINPGSVTWLRKAAESLEEGYILTIDYGYDEHDIPGKKDGTLMCFYQHTFNRKPFIRAGYQDITGHVNFTPLIREGEKSGLKVEEYTSQRDFLLSLGIEKKIKRLDKTTMNLLDYNRELNGLNRLIDERGLGNIKVLIQKKIHQ
jgi:SAM-dependent MidA family methyltransferase